MFKRSFRRSSPRTWARRGPSTAKLQRSKAPRRYNWVNLLDSVCDSGWMPPRLCSQTTGDAYGPMTMDCATGLVTPGVLAKGIRLELLPPNGPDGQGGLGAYSSDDVTLVKMVGHVDLLPMYYLTKAGRDLIDAAPEWRKELSYMIALAQRNWFLRAGLKKDDFVYNADLNLYEAPPRDPLSTTEWTDGRYLKMWQRERMPFDNWNRSFTSTSGQTVLGYATHQAAYDVPEIETDAGGCISEGSGCINVHRDGYTVPEATVVTQFAGTDAGVGQPAIHITPERPIRLNLNSRRKLRFRENQGLSLWLNYTTIDYTRANPDCSDLSPPLVAAGWYMRPHVKGLFETA